MTYQFTREPRTVWWPVTVNVPRDDGVDQVIIRVKLKLPKRSDVRLDTLTPEKAAEYILDWDGIIDQSTKEPLPFTRENLAALREDAFFEKALAVGLVRAAVGASEKN